MNAQFNFELVSPEKKLLSESCWQVTIPGQEGDVGVRAGHMSLLMVARAGVVEIIASQGDKPKRYFIAGGFADVGQQHCTVLAEEAYDLSNIDAVKLEAELDKLKQDYAAQPSDEAKQKNLNRQAFLVQMIASAKK